MASSQYGNYYVQERIATGGMAGLFLAAGHSGQFVALRVLQPQHLKSRVHVRQFMVGCEVLSLLNHPSIPKYFGQGRQADGLPWVAMEYVPSPNMRERQRDDQEELWVQSASLLLSMAAGLNHIHERGYLHMDFKPENLLVMPHGQVKIIDFDLAIKRPTRLTKLPLAGTAVYMAPELLLEQPTDERADIFAFGAVAFELVTGKKPFGAGTAQEMRNKARLGTPYKELPSICDLNVKASRKLDRVIRACLAKDLKARYPVMSLVLRDLQSMPKS